MTDAAIYLNQALALVAKKHGVNFAVNVDISTEKVDIPNLDDRASAIRELLKKYNWVGVHEKNELIQVIICGKAGDSFDTPSSTFISRVDISNREKLNNWHNVEYIETN